jgi:hypothetical protein
LKAWLFGVVCRIKTVIENVIKSDVLKTWDLGICLLGKDHKEVDG